MVEEINEKRNFHGRGWGETVTTIPGSERGSVQTE